MTLGELPLRARLRRLLTQADVHDRYRLMSRSVLDLETGCVNVHGKLMAGEDDLMLI